MSKTRDRKSPRQPANGASQVAALPYRLAPGGLEVLLITSRETRRWVIPKGWPMKGRTAYEAAAQEALEEAGVLGEIDAAPAGTYRYDKLLKTGAAVLCEVQVFPMRVTRQLDSWVEQHQRDFQWFPSQEAAEMVAEPDLAALIRTFTP